MLKKNLSLYRRIMTNLNINANHLEADARLLFESLLFPGTCRRCCTRKVLVPDVHRLPISKMPRTNSVPKL